MRLRWLVWCLLSFAVVAQAETHRVVLEDWATALKSTQKIGTLFASSQSDWSALSKDKEWKQLQKQNQEVVSELKGLHLASDTSWVKSELQNEKKLSTLMSVLQFDLLQARQLVVQKKYDQAGQIWSAWMQVAHDVTLNEGGVVGLRLAVLIRSLLFDDLERELKMPNSKWKNVQMLLDKFRNTYKLWPVDKIVKNTLAEFQLQIASEASKRNPQEFFEKFYGPSGDRLKELLAGHKNVLNIEEVLADTNHYTQYMVELFNANPYSPSSMAIEKVQKEMWARLRGEAGNAGFILDNITTLEVEGRKNGRKLAELDSLSKDDFKAVKKHFYGTANPLGRLLVTEYLYHLGQIWRDYDVGSMKTELSRASWIQGMMAIRSYRAQFKQNPKSMEELVSQQILKEIPMNYYISQPLKYSAKVGRLDLVTVQ